MGGEKISITVSGVVGGRESGTSSENKLVYHEFAVVFASQTRPGSVAWISGVGTAGPLPDDCKQTLHEMTFVLCHALPFEFGGQACILMTC